MVVIGTVSLINYDEWCNYTYSLYLGTHVLISCTYYALVYIFYQTKWLFYHTTYFDIQVTKRFYIQESGCCQRPERVKTLLVVRKVVRWRDSCSPGPNWYINKHYSPIKIAINIIIEFKFVLDKPTVHWRHGFRVRAKYGRTRSSRSNPPRWQSAAGSHNRTPVFILLLSCK